MSNYKNKIITLFGEEHWESDEEVLEAERHLKQKLKRAFGSDSEEDKSSLSDVMELSCSDIEEEEEPTNISINRIVTQPQQEDDIAYRRALAQYQRQMAARVTRQPTDEPIQLPKHIVARRTEGELKRPHQEDTIMSEEELFRTTERMIYGRTLQQVTEEILDKVQYQPSQAVPIISSPAIQEASISKAPSTTSGDPRSRKEKRQEAKKKWILRKKMKTLS